MRTWAGRDPLCALSSDWVGHVYDGVCMRVCLHVCVLIYMCVGFFAGTSECWCGWVRSLCPLAPPDFGAAFVLGLEPCAALRDGFAGALLPGEHATARFPDRTNLRA